MTSLSGGWLVVIFSLPVAALLSFCGCVARTGRSSEDAGMSDWPRRLLTCAVGLMPEDDLFPPSAGGPYFPPARRRSAGDRP